MFKQRRGAEKGARGGEAPRRTGHSLVLLRRDRGQRGCEGRDLQFDLLFTIHGGTTRRRGDDAVGRKRPIGGARDPSRRKPCCRTVSGLGGGYPGLGSWADPVYAGETLRKPSCNLPPFGGLSGLVLTPAGHFQSYSARLPTRESLHCRGSGGSAPLRRTPALALPSRWWREVLGGPHRKAAARWVAHAPRSPGRLPGASTVF